MSVKYELVKSYYDRGLWNSERVLAAVGKWVTQEEATEIIELSKHERT